MLRLLIVALVVTVAACGSALARLDASDLRDIASQVGKASAADKTNAAEPVPVVSRPSVGWLERPAPGVRRKTVIAVETGALVIVSSEEGVQVALVQRLYLALISQVDETDVAVIAALPETCALRECTVLEPAVITRVAHAALATRSGAEGSRTIVASNQLGKAAIQPEPDTEAKTDTGSHDTAANPPPDPLGVWLRITARSCWVWWERCWRQSLPGSRLRTSVTRFARSLPPGRLRPPKRHRQRLPRPS